MDLASHIDDVYRVVTSVGDQQEPGGGGAREDQVTRPVARAAVAIYKPELHGALRVPKHAHPGHGTRVTGNSEHIQGVGTVVGGDQQAQGGTCRHAPRTRTASASMP